MNEYKIIYTVQGEEDSYDVKWVERTEASARRAFLRNQKEMGVAVEVSGIELIRDDACATKQQERDALEVIRKMVAELGPQSYLATAFEGCFEIAGQNIEFDFADSQKGRLECAEKKLADAGERIKRLESDISILTADLENARSTRDCAIGRMKAQGISLDDLEDIRLLLDDRIAECAEKAQRAAQDIVRYAEDTTGAEFRQAVLDNRNYTQKAEHYRGLLDRVAASSRSAVQTDDIRRDDHCAYEAQ